MEPLFTGGAHLFTPAGGGGGPTSRNVVFGAEPVTLAAEPLTIIMEGTGDVELADALAALTGAVVIGSSADSITITSLGNISILGGDGDNGGQVLIKGGNTDEEEAEAGKVTIQGGQATAADSDGGEVQIICGNSTLGFAGNLRFELGDGGGGDSRFSVVGCRTDNPNSSDEIWNDTGAARVLKVSVDL